MSSPEPSPLIASSIPSESSSVAVISLALAHQLQNLRQNGGCLARLFVEPDGLAPRFASSSSPAALCFMMRAAASARRCARPPDGRDGGG